MTKCKLPQCQCGCGGLVSKVENRFILGHNNRGENHYFYGKHHSVEHRKKMSDVMSDENHYFYGKHHSVECRKKMSDAQKGEKNHSYGKHPPAETRKKMSDAAKGENNYNWKGGISFEPYCSKFNKELKEKIRDRDNNICQLCGKKEGNKKLSVHHIHYDKENCYPDLVTLCTSCNAKVNGIRDYWEVYFMRQLFFRMISITIYNLESELDIWNYGDF